MKITLGASEIEEALKTYLESKYKISVEKFDTNFRYWDGLVLEYKTVEVDEAIITPGRRIDKVWRGEDGYSDYNLYYFDGHGISHYRGPYMGYIYADRRKACRAAI